VKLRKLSIMLILAIALSLVPVAAFASATVSLNNISSINPGGSVAISGSSTLPEVIVSVLRPNNTNLYYNVIKVTNGVFSDSFTLGSVEPVGTYKVIVGQGNQVALANFDVSAGASTPTPPCTVNCSVPLPPTITGPDGPASPTPTPSTTPAPTNKPVPPAGTKAEPVEVDSSKNILKPTTSADGHVTNSVTQDDTALADALSKAAKQDNQGDAPIVAITFNNPAGESVVFNISSTVLAAAASSAPNTIVSLQTNDGVYSLPLNIINFASLAESLGTTNDKISIQVNISAVTADLNDKIKSNAQGSSTSQLGSAIEFSITAVGNGKSVELNNFGTTYVERNIVLAVPVDETHATVVLYDPTSGQFSFVPAVFEKQADGSTKVTFKRNGNSIYTVLSSTKTFKDVTKHWAKTDIELLASKLVVNGVSDSRFSPDSNISRAEFAALLVRSLGLTSDAGSAAFTDVKSSDWFAGAIGAAVKAKLVDGFADKSFKPNATITREQMAVMVSRAITAAGKTMDVSGNQNAVLAKFKDNASISSWAQVAVAESVEANIISGMTDKTFVPSANATRAQSVVMLKRLMQYTGFIN
jgi:hypothetical protein